MILARVSSWNESVLNLSAALVLRSNHNNPCSRCAFSFEAADAVSLYKVVVKEHPMARKKLYQSQHAGIDLFIFDGDGTSLTKEHTVPQSTIEAITMVDEDDKYSTLCTGRCVPGAQPIARQMNLRRLPLRKGPGIIFGALNGGVAVDLNGRVIHEVRLGARRTAQVIDALRRRDGVGVWLQTATEWFVIGEHDRCVQYEMDVLGTRPIYLNPRSRLPLSQTVKVAAVSWEPEALFGLSKSLQDGFGNRVSVSQSHAKEVDVTDAEADKGGFVRLVRRLTGIPKLRTAAIGDMYNDLPMFRESRVSIAMGNAPQAVKALATHQAPCNSEDGFAWAVRNIVLAA